MQITNDYLQEFAVPPSNPGLIELHDWEMPHTASISLDDADRHSLGVVHWDDWPSPQGWRQEGTEKRWTFVTLQKDGETVGSIGYEFYGLVRLDDLRTWFRAKLGADAIPSESQWPWPDGSDNDNSPQAAAA